MHHYQLNILSQLLLLAARGALAVDYAQLAIQWCLDHPEAEGGYAQCVRKLACKAPGQEGQTDPASAACVSYGECDCSRFEDRDSDEYFECIGQPNCAACTSSEITPAPTTSSVYGLATLTPGTYTFIVDGMTETGVVPSPTATATEFITVTSAVTMTITVNPTSLTTTHVPFTPSTNTTTIFTSPKTTTVSFTPTATTNITLTTIVPSSTEPPTCPSYCDCEPKYGDPEGYEDCLSQPECAGCGIPFPPLPYPTSVPTATSWQNSTSTVSTTTTPSPSCSASCDCSKIADKSSDAYFQCITDPNCEHCLIGGRHFRKRSGMK